MFWTATNRDISKPSGSIRAGVLSSEERTAVLQAFEQIWEASDELPVILD